MKLLYKQKILNGFSSIKRPFFEESIIEYARNLHHNSDDPYNCYNYLTKIKDAEYCGEGIDERANYYLYDGDVFYWFYDARDAAEFASDNEGTEDYTTIGSSASDFYKNSVYAKTYGHKYQGFYWLLPEDIYKLDEILSTPPAVFCETKNIVFENVASAALWLVNSGKASNIRSATQSLEKHLNGGSAYCYSMKFRRI